jgi:hypothetical protein
MTSEHRTLIDLADVLGIEFQCHKCDATVLQPLHGDSSRKKLYSCPVCGEPWYLTQRSTDAPDVVAVFIDTFKSLTDHKDIFAKTRLCVSRKLPASVSDKSGASS